MDREGLRYFRQDNCFPWIEDVSRAQQLFQEQLTVNWTGKLERFAERPNPLHQEIFQNYPSTYYWTAFQCEWATDVMFRPGTLRRLSPLFLQHAMLGLSSPDVMKFLGHRINVSGQIPANFRGELTMDFKSRATGDRVKYRMDGNPLKGYGKASTPLPTCFVWRPPPKTWSVSRSTGPSRVSPRIICVGKGCGVGWPTCSAAPRSHKKSTNASMMRSPQWTTAPGSANSPEPWNSPVHIREGVSARCISSGPTIISYYKPSIEESSC
jgi:hypothetical protein